MSGETSTYEMRIRKCENELEKNFSDAALEEHLRKFQETGEFDASLSEELELSVGKMGKRIEELSEEMSRKERAPFIGKDFVITEDRGEKGVEEYLAHFNRKFLEVLGHRCSREKEERAKVTDYFARMARGRFRTETALKMLRFLVQKERAA